MGEIFNNRLLFNSIMLLFSLLCSGEFCGGTRFYMERDKVVLGGWRGTLMCNIYHSGG